MEHGEHLAAIEPGVVVVVLEWFVSMLVAHGAGQASMTLSMAVA